MAEKRINGPLESRLGFQVGDEGIGLLKMTWAGKFTSTATVVTPFATIHGAILQSKGKTAPTSTTPVFTKVEYSGATVYLYGFTATFGPGSSAATFELYVKGIY